LKFDQNVNIWYNNDSKKDINSFVFGSAQANIVAAARAKQTKIKQIMQDTRCS
jgi:hypothetical protein